MKCRTFTYNPTHSTGTVVQHLQYLSYGEPVRNQRMSGYSERFTFTGKERDTETGYGYFGARYMDHELMTMWTSVDPMSDKYPSISPYAYCAWNPMKLVDPDGREIILKGSYECRKRALDMMRCQLKKRSDFSLIMNEDGYITYSH